MVFIIVGAFDPPIAAAIVTWAVGQALVDGSEGELTYLPR
jgi:hypothetical protein